MLAANLSKNLPRKQPKTYCRWRCSDQAGGHQGTLMLKFGCISVYLKYWTLNLMALMVYLMYYSIQTLASKPWETANLFGGYSSRAAMRRRSSVSGFRSRSTRPLVALRASFCAFFSEGFSHPTSGSCKTSPLMTQFGGIWSTSSTWTLNLDPLMVYPSSTIPSEFHHLLKSAYNPCIGQTPCHL